MQIGMIVRNVDETVAQYRAMGVDGWEIAVMNNTIPPFEDLKFDGQELPVKGDIIKTAMVTAYGLEIELIEPIAPCTAYYRWLKEHGPGLHHVAMDVGEDYDGFVAECREKTGKEPWISGTAIHGLMDYSYIDLREQMGLIVECYRHLQPNKPFLKYDTKAEVTKG